MISIDELERAAAPGWRGLEEEPLGDWLLRAAGGFTGRANSALAIGDPGLPVDVAAERVAAWYRARGLPAMIAVSYPAAEPHRSALDAALAGLGWTPRARPATVMIAAADGVARCPHDISSISAIGTLPNQDTRSLKSMKCGLRERAGGVPVASGGLAGDGAGRPAGGQPHIGISSEPDEAWLARYHYGGTQLPPVARQVLLSAPWQAFASVREGGATVAIGRVAGAASWAGLTAIEVDPRCRRRGLGAAVTAALAAAARRRGADWLYLQVEDDNAAARAVYARLGFAAHHGYHYRVAPAPS